MNMPTTPAVQTCLVLLSVFRDHFFTLPPAERTEVARRAMEVLNAPPTSGAQRSTPEAK